MTTETDTAAEAAPTSREDKFFGVTTSIEDMIPKGDDPEKDKIIIEEAKEDEPVTATPDKPAKKVEAGASDDDMEEHSAKVQKRIDKLTWQRKEAERQNTAIAAERDEAFRVAKNLHQQSQQQANIINTGEARLIDEINSRAQLAMEAARTNYAKAHEEGDTDGIVKAQEAMGKAQYGNEAAAGYKREYETRVRNWAAQQQQQAQQRQWQAQQPAPQPQAKPPSEAANSWSKNNPWFGKNEHRDMTAIAYATHETMIRDEGISPDSDAYFEKLDATMKQRFPEYFEVDPEHSSQPTSTRHAVVAPATRTGANTRKVTLNASQRSLAKTLGITEQQYANQLLQENKRG